ncbi:MAG: Smr/MutS family protein [Bacteroidetes bacterium]|nr:Smr/MutS family protein [Bacteroidota bacterium]
MRCFPATALDKLGFAEIRARLQASCYTQEARDLYADLVPGTDADAIRHRLGLTWELMDLLQKGISIPLQQLPHMDPLVRQLESGGTYLTEQELHRLRQFLRAAAVLAEFLQKTPDKPQLAALLRLYPIDLGLPAAIDQVLGPDGRMRDDASPELRNLRRELVRVGVQLREHLSRMLQQAKRQGHVPPDAEVTLRNDRLVLPIPSHLQGQYPGFVQDVSASGQTVFLEPAASLQLNNQLRELQVRMHNEVLRILQQVSDALRKDLPAIRAMRDLTIRFDGLHAAARLGRAMDATPRWQLLPPRKPLKLLQARHPVLSLQKGADKVIPFRMELGDRQRILVISGPNAGGKSVLLTACGLLQVMAQCGLPLPVEPDSQLPLCTRLFVYIGDDQNLQQDLSTYTSHLTHMRQALEALMPDSLLLIDEFGTGTDPALGGPLAEALLESFVTTQAKGVINTHYSNLKERASHTEGLCNGAMSFDLGTLSPTYRFVQGQPGSSYAFEIAARVGLPQPVLQRAAELAGQGRADSDRLLAQLRQQQQEQQQLRQEMAGRLAALEAREQAVMAQQQQLKQQVKTELELARKQAAAIVREANKRIEATIREIKEAQAEREATLRLRKELQESFILEPTPKEQRRKRVQYAPLQDHPLSTGAQVQIADTGNVGLLLEVGTADSLVALGELRTRVANDRLVVVAAQAPGSAVRHHVPQELRTRTVPTTLDVRGMRVEQALPILDKFLDDLQLSSYSQAEILHGKGTGALRNAIRQHIAKLYPAATCTDAPEQQGGSGITLVNLFPAS